MNLKTTNYIGALATPIGQLIIEASTIGITKVYFTNQTIQKVNPNVFVEQAIVQLDEYFKLNRTQFKLPLDFYGTTFQIKVWKTLLQIPFGATKSYLQIAQEIGNPKVIRAAASANGKNPIAILIPCHRVIGSNGSLIGYAGGLHRKKWLLQHESAINQLEMF